MAKGKKQNKNQEVETVNGEMLKKNQKDKKLKNKKAASEQPVENAPVEPPKEEVCKPTGECKCCPCKCCCCPIRLFFTALLIAVGFVFYIIIRDSEKVTFELCKTDAEECVHKIVEVLTPYMNPYKMIDYLHMKGYVH